MIIDHLYGQLEGSVSGSTVQHHAEGREEGQDEIFPLLVDKISTCFLPLHIRYVICTLIKILKLHKYIEKAQIFL